MNNHKRKTPISNTPVPLCLQELSFKNQLCVVKSTDISKPFKRVLKMSETSPLLEYNHSLTSYIHCFNL